MKNYEIQKIISLADNYYTLSSDIKKIGAAQVIIGGIIVAVEVLAVVLPIIGIAVGEITKLENIKQDLEVILTTMDTYEKNNSEIIPSEYKQGFKNFKDYCAEFIKSYNILTTTTPNLENAAQIYDELEKFNKYVGLVQEWSGMVSGALTEMQNPGGRVASIAWNLGWPAVWSTDTIKIKDGINNLIEHIGIQKPLLNDKFKDIQKAVEDAQKKYAEQPEKDKVEDKGKDKGEIVESKYPPIDTQIQKILGVGVDGALGPDTQSKLDEYKKTTGKQLTNEQAIEELKKTPNYRTGKPIFAVKPIQSFDSEESESDPDIEQFSGIFIQ